LCESHHRYIIGEVIVKGNKCKEINLICGGNNDYYITKVSYKIDGLYQTSIRYRLCLAMVYKLFTSKQLFYFYCAVDRVFLKFILLKLILK